MDASVEWTPEVVEWNERTCAELAEEQERTCACKSRTAPRYFASPAEFANAVDTPPAKLTPSQRALVQRLSDACPSVLSSEWTPEAREELVLTARSNVATNPMPLTDAAVTELANCNASKWIALLPGGPRAADRLGKARVHELSKQVADQCSDEYERRLLAAWSPEFGKLWMYRCIEILPEVTREECSCFLAEGPKIFSVPDDFMRFWNTPLEKQTASQRIAQRQLAACFKESLTGRRGNARGK